MGKSFNQNNALKMSTPPRREPRMKKFIKLEPIQYASMQNPEPLFIIAFGISKFYMISCMTHLPTLLLTNAEEMTWVTLRENAKCDHCLSPDEVFSVTLGGRKIGTRVLRRKK